MGQLTKQEQTVIAAVLALLLLGWAVKTWRVSREGPATTVPMAAPR